MDTKRSHLRSQEDATIPLVLVHYLLIVYDNNDSTSYALLRENNPQLGVRREAKHSLTHMTLHVRLLNHIDARLHQDPSNFARPCNLASATADSTYPPSSSQLNTASFQYHADPRIRPLQRVYRLTASPQGNPSYAQRVPLTDQRCVIRSDLDPLPTPVRPAYRHPP
jgi:hypothetical protein